MSMNTSNLLTHDRLIDLVRYQRTQLHEAGLITDQEYADIVAIGSASARRLESYDELRAENLALQAQSLLYRAIISQVYSWRANNKPAQEWPEAVCALIGELHETPPPRS